MIWQSKWREAVWVAAAGDPALTWYGWVQVNSSPYRYESSFVPLSGIYSSLIHPEAYPASVPFADVIRLGDAIGLVGILLAFALGIWQLRRGRPDALSLAAAMFAFIGIFVQRADFWTSAFNYGRIYSPLLIFLAFIALRDRSWFGLIPWIAISTRVGLQFGPQVVGLFQKR
jgi:hypothetical protein